jgi:hypothetical protein
MPTMKSKPTVSGKTDPACHEIDCSTKKQDLTKFFAKILRSKADWRESDGRAGYFFVCRGASGRITQPVME